MWSVNSILAIGLAMLAASALPSGPLARSITPLTPKAPTSSGRPVTRSRRYSEFVIGLEP
jgi:hypothetical protein